MKSCSKSFALLLATTCLSAAVSQGALAQETAPPAPAAADDKPDQDIVVTGSRIAQNGNNMPTPVTVVTAADLAVSRPTTLIDALNTLPVFSGSRGQQSNPISSGSAGAGAPASNQLNLRNLGANRTLVLFDGQRVAPTTIAGVVDADIIPQMLIQRVEVVTGGVSAVYGSDAVAGVVNFIPDTKFKGIRLQAQLGETDFGDNRNWKAGIAVGTSLLDDRLHLMASFEHYDTRGVLDRWSRPWNNYYGVVGTGLATDPYNVLANLRNNSATFGGLITGPTSGLFRDQQFKTNGVLTPFVHGTSTQTRTAEVGGDGYFQSASMVAPLRFDQMYLRADLELSDSLRAHVQGARNYKRNELAFNWPLFTGLTMNATNPFLSQTYRDAFANANQSTFTFAKVFSQAPRLEPKITSDQIILNAGLDGNVGSWKWNLSANYGKTTLNNNFHNNINLEKLAASLDAVVNPANNQIVCYSALMGTRPDCVPLNLFGPNSASQAAIDYISKTTHFTAHTKMVDFNGAVSGSLFDTWAGPVSAAVSGEWRKVTYDSSTDASALALANCTGLRYNCTQGRTLLWNDAFAGRTPVSVSVKEAAVEVEMPLLKDSAFGRSLVVNGAARYTSYSTSGNYWTWKGGVDWKITDALKFRGTISRDIRAPTLNDLFAPVSTQATQVQDLLTGATPNIPSYRGGNPNVKAEIGKTKTFGIVWQPESLPGFSVSLDAFFITIDDAIVGVKGEDTVVQRACYASGGTSNYCTLQTRPIDFVNTTSANTVTSWAQYAINISTIKTKGADLEINYRTRMFGRPADFRSFVTYQPHTVYSQPGLPDVDMGGAAYGPSPLVASPSVRVTLTQSFEPLENFRVDLQERYRNSMRLSGDTSFTIGCCRVPAVAYVDLNLTYKLKTGFGEGEVFFNVQNLLDKTPPVTAPPGSSTPGAMGGWAVGDDPLGRAFLGGIRFKM
jgi:outer membrane receptor protein involved in Fe transport